MANRNYSLMIFVCCLFLALGGATAGYCNNALTMGAGGGCISSNMDVNDYIAVGVGRTFYLGGGQARGGTNTMIVASRDTLIGDKSGAPEEICRCSDMPEGADLDNRGCWVVAHFAFEKADITSESADELDAAVGVLKNNPEMNIEIQGHTCSMGPLSYNQLLSEKRAKAVYDYLITNGISGPRMACKGFAFTRPAASNDTPEGRTLNRRVELQPLKQPE